MQPSISVYSNRADAYADNHSTTKPARQGGGPFCWGLVVGLNCIKVYGQQTHADVSEAGLSCSGPHCAWLLWPHDPGAYLSFCCSTSSAILGPWKTMGHFLQDSNLKGFGAGVTPLLISPLLQPIAKWHLPRGSFCMLKYFAVVEFYNFSLGRTQNTVTSSRHGV